MVNDPFVYGQISAANSISDVYAMGGTPKTALNLVGYPDDKLSLDWLAEIVRGGEERCQAAGVVGHRTYLFDLWGDTVNTAARVESHGENGAVNVSASVWERVRGHCEGRSRGSVNLKGRGAMDLYVVERLAPAARVGG